MTRRTHNTGRSEPQTPSLNEVLIFKAGLATTTLLGILLLASAFFAPAEIKLLDEGTERSEATRQLIERLEQLGAAWEPRQRQRLLDRAPERAQEFAGPLDRILRTGDPGDPTLLEAAVEYAGAMGVAGLRPTLVRMTLPSSRELPAAIRAKAMQSAEQLGRWSREELADFLSRGSPPMKLAALEICAGRQDAPWTEILVLLNGGDDGDNTANRKLTAAAIQAIPEVPPAELVRALWDMIAYGDPNSIVLGLRALRGARLERDLYVRLARRLDRMDSEARILCLDLLGRTGRPLPDREPVWRLVTNSATGPLVRARALYCLEQTASFHVDEIRKQVFFMEPLARYFAARCLLAAGEAQGAKLLLDLMDNEEEELSICCRRLLAWMTGRGPTTSRAGFQRSLAGVRQRLPGQLPAPGYDFGNRPAAPGSPR